MATVAELRALAEQVAPTTLGVQQRLPVLDALGSLIPGGGLQRGSTLSVDGRAATSLALAVAAGASQDGAWVAAIGFPSLGLLAAADVGIAIERFVLVAAPDTAPGPDNESVAWASAVAALVDAFDVVLVAADVAVRSRDARRLEARVRERGGVLVLCRGGGTGEGSGTRGSGARGSGWPEAADVSLTVTEVEWQGLDHGHGYLRARRVAVTGGGRRQAARPRHAHLWLPSPDGAIVRCGDGDGRGVDDEPRSRRRWPRGA